MFQTPPSRTVNGSGAEPRQSRKLVVALGLLLITLVVVLVKDRDFWFGTDRATIESDMPAAAAPAPQATAKAVTPAQPIATPAPKRTSPTKTSAKPTSTASSQPATTNQPPVAIRRTVLPPLEVEVVAGSKHHTVRPGSNATRLAVENSDSSALKQSDLAAATKAAEREPLAADASRPQYPLLAQHMNVMGSVVLQALIGVDGSIENLRVTSGPAILANAAQQAVREWHFKPIKENGQAVESTAVITVNFSIRVADNASNPTIADNQPERIEILR